MPDRSAEPHALARQSGITAVVALLAVASGFLLDLAWWHRLGVGAGSDAIALALRLPLALAAVTVALGAQVLVPTFTAWRVELAGDREAGAVTGLLLWLAGAGLAGAGVLALLAGPAMRLLSPDWSPATLDAAAHLTRILAIYLPALAGAEVLRSWLISRLVIGFPAAMSLVLNLVGIPIILLGPARIETVAWAYAAGALAQVAVMAALAHHHGWRARRPRPRDPAVWHTLGLLRRPTLAAGLNPVMRVVEGIVVSFLPVGSATVVHYGNRIASALGGTVVFRSVMVALIPRLGTALAKGDEVAAARLLRHGIRLVALLAVPMTLLGLVLFPAVTPLVFGDRPGTAGALPIVLAVYALSFAGSGLQRALLAPFFAARRMAEPLRNTAYGVVANAGLLLTLYPLASTWAHPVLAVPIAYAASQYVNVGHAWRRARRLPGLGRLGLAPALAGSLLCGLAGALAAWLVLRIGAADASGALRPVMATIAGLGVSAATGFATWRRGFDRDRA